MKSLKAVILHYDEAHMNIRELRFKRRISQWELSKISGVHQSRISLIENGFQATEKEQNLLAKALGISADVLLKLDIGKAHE